MTGAILVGLSALGYGFNPIFGKFAYQAGANAITIMAIRYCMAALVLWGMLALQKHRDPVPLSRRLQLLAMGGLGMGVISLLYFTALQHIGASLATGLFYTYPAFVALAGAFRGEAIGKAGIAGLCLTAAGTWMMLGGNLGGFTWGGALLILAASGLHAAYFIVGSAWTRGLRPVTVSTYVSTGAAAVSLLAAVLTRQSVPGAGAFLAGAGLALFTTVFAVSLFFAGLPKVGPTRAAIISNLEPVFTAFLAVGLLSERLSWLQLIGIGLVVVGAVAAQLRDRLAEAPVAKEA